MKREPVTRVNPLDGVVLSGTRDEQDRELRARVRDAARKYRAFCESIDDLILVDRMGLTRIALGRILEGAVYERGRRIESEHSARCICVSLAATAEAFELPLPFEAWVEPLFGTLEHWAWRAEAIEAGGAEHPAYRRFQVVGMIRRETLRTFGPERNVAQFERAARKAMRDMRMDVNEAGGDQRIDREDVHSVISLYRRSTWGTPGGIFRGRDGSIQLSATDVRDEVRRVLEIPRDPTPLETRRAELGEQPEYSDAMDDPLQCAAMQEAVDALTAFQAAQVAAASTKKKKAVLGLLAEHLVEGVTEAEIADKTGTSRVFVNKTFRLAKEAFARSRRDEG